MSDAPTVDELGTEGDVARLVADLAASANAEAEAGGTLASADGFQMTQGRRRSLVRYGDREMPERVKVYDRRGRTSLVPTATLAYHLNKKNPSDGKPVFFARPPEGVEAEPVIDETCVICLPKGVRKRFVSRYDHRAHMETMHPREFAMLQEEKAEARADRGLLDSLLTLSPEQRATLRELLFDEPKKPKKSE